MVVVGWALKRLGWAYHLPVPVQYNHYVKTVTKFMQNKDTAITTSEVSKYAIIVMYPYNIMYFICILV